MYKLIQNSIFIQIGLKLAIVMAIVFSLSSCWYLFPKEDDYYFDGYINNSTNDTLQIIQGSDTSNYSWLDTIYIPKNEKVRYKGEGLNKDDDIIKEFLNIGTRLQLEQTRVYVGDDLVINWIGPPRKLGDSINHFYNYDSWEYWLEDDKNGVIQFTIYESDFE